MMFSSIFKNKKTATKEVVVAVAEKPKAKTHNEIVDEIHESFFTEVDKLLADAKVLKSCETVLPDLIKKQERLEALGFGSTQECKAAAKEIERLEAIKKENATKEHIAAAIEYFSFKYPMYKFITEDSVKKICNKYGLVYASVDKYIGTVPDKNLDEMEKFKISDDDALYVYEVGTIMRGFLGSTTKNYNIPKSEYLRILKKIEDGEQEKTTLSPYSMISHNLFKAPLEIAAPLKDFDQKRMEVVDYKLVPVVDKDPIVLQPVFFGGQKHYLVVTAWGQEATDADVLNSRHN